MDRDAARATYRQGNDLFDHYQFPEAGSAYAQAINQDPQFLEAYFNRALADEMVERHKAIADWRQFVELAAGNPDFVDEVGQAKARVQVLGMLPEYPEALQPSRYVSGAADYYADISENSESHKWNSFPIRVSLGDVPTADWAQGEREAFRIWKGLFPLELTAEADERAPWVVWCVMPEIICIAFATPSVPRTCCFEASEISCTSSADWRTTLEIASSALPA